MGRIGAVLPLSPEMPHGDSLHLRNISYFTLFRVPRSSFQSPLGAAELQVKCIGMIVVDEFIPRQVRRFWLGFVETPLTCFVAECCAFDSTCHSGNRPMKIQGRVCLPEGYVDSAGGVGTMFGSLGLQRRTTRLTL
jgi:hypothetical protein